jgi:hypothetical protein
VTPRDRAVEALGERGAATLEHPGGTLLAHLVRTSDLLEAWGSPPELVLAGAAHAAYGTDGFPTALFGLDERDTVASLVGAPAEAIVNRYCRCDRRATYPSIGTGGDVAFVDRLTGAVEVVAPDDVRAFAELTVANELDVLRHSEAVRREHGPALAALFARWTDVIGPAARNAVETLGE